MFRLLVGGATRICNQGSLLQQCKPTTNFSTLQYQPQTTSLLNNPCVQQIAETTKRSVTKFSWQEGKRKSVKVVMERFYRLNWGGWIRTKCGRNKKLWKKHAAQKKRLQQHVFCNATQSRMLDKMVGSYWRKPKYYVDDPYEPYHTREECVFTYKVPRPYVRRINESACD